MAFSEPDTITGCAHPENVAMQAARQNTKTPEGLDIGRPRSLHVGRRLFGGSKSLRQLTHSHGRFLLASEGSGFMRGRGAEGIGVAIAGILVLSAVSMPASADVLPEETPECDNGQRVRACVHPTFTARNLQNRAAIEACNFSVFADFLFDDPFFATPMAGQFSWSWSWSISSGGSGSDSGQFDGVPLYPMLGLVVGDTVQVDLEQGETFRMTSFAMDHRPMLLEDDAQAYLEVLCPL